MQARLFKRLKNKIETILEQAPEVAKLKPRQPTVDGANDGGSKKRKATDNLLATPSKKPFTDTSDAASPQPIYVVNLAADTTTDEDMSVEEEQNVTQDADAGEERDTGEVEEEADPEEEDGGPEEDVGADEEEDVGADGEEDVGADGEDGEDDTPTDYADVEDNDNV